MSYYEVLGVTRNATQGEIREAYLNLIQQYHPDHNRAFDAHQKTLALNEAYSVLSSPSSRRSYDELLTPSGPKIGNRTSPGPTGANTAAPEIPPIVCFSCGKTSPDLLLSEFLQVISLVFVTHRKETRGIWCDQCRAGKAFKFTGLSLVLGWWGIPWGPFLTVWAMVKNSSASVQKKAENAQLLRAVGYQLFMRERYAESAQALSASLKRQFNQPTKDFREFVLKMCPSQPAELRRWRRWIVALPAASLAALVLLIGFAASDSTSSVTRYPAVQGGSYSAPNQALSYSPANENLPPPNRLANGTEIRRRLRTNGRGDLTVENGTSGDAVVVVVDVATNQVIRGFYVVSGMSFTERNIRAGTYLILFATGSDWNPSLRSFNRDASEERFGKDLEFTESDQQQSGGITHYYTKEEISLQPVVGGTVAISPIDRSTFDSLLNQPDPPAVQ